VFLLVQAHPGSAGQRAIKRLLLLLLCKRSMCSEISYNVSSVV